MVTSCPEGNRMGVTYEATAPDEGRADGREEDADDEQRREDGAGCEDGLPCLQSLLLEGSI